MVASYVGVAVAQHIHAASPDQTWTSPLSVVTTLTFIVSFAIGPAPAPYLYLAVFLSYSTSFIFRLNSLFRSRDWLSANQGPVFPNPHQHTGSIPWLIVAEIFTSDSRGKASSLCVGANWICNLTVCITYKYLDVRMGNCTTVGPRFTGMLGGKGFARYIGVRLYYRTPI
eukprot:sb/3472253/